MLKVNAMPTVIDPYSLDKSKQRLLFLLLSQPQEWWLANKSYTLPGINEEIILTHNIVPRISRLSTDQTKRNRFTIYSDRDLIGASRASVYFSPGEFILKNRKAIFNVHFCAVKVTSDIESKKEKQKQYDLTRKLPYVRPKGLTFVESETGLRAYEFIHFVVGKNFEEKNFAELNSKERLQVSHALLLNLKVIHKALITHRDIKPANVMMEENGNVFIIDFDSIKPSYMIDGVNIKPAGTPGYVSPEVLSLRNTTDKSDIYGIGRVFHEKIWSDLETLSDLSLAAKEQIRNLIQSMLNEMPWLRPDLPRLIRHFENIMKQEEITLQSKNDDVNTSISSARSGELSGASSETASNPESDNTKYVTAENSPSFRPIFSPSEQLIATQEETTQKEISDSSFDCSFDSFSDDSLDPPAGLGLETVSSSSHSFFSKKAPQPIASPLPPKQKIDFTESPTTPPFARMSSPNPMGRGAGASKDPSPQPRASSPGVVTRIEYVGDKKITVTKHFGKGI